MAKYVQPGRGRGRGRNSRARNPVASSDVTETFGKKSTGAKPADIRIVEKILGLDTASTLTNNAFITHPKKNPSPYVHKPKHPPSTPRFEVVSEDEVDLNASQSDDDNLRVDLINLDAFVDNFYSMFRKNKAKTKGKFKIWSERWKNENEELIVLKNENEKMKEEMDSLKKDNLEMRNFFRKNFSDLNLELKKVSDKKINLLVKQSDEKFEEWKFILEKDFFTKIRAEREHEAEKQKTERAEGDEHLFSKLKTYSDDKFIDFKNILDKLTREVEEIQKSYSDSRKRDEEISREALTFLESHKDVGRVNISELKKYFT